MIIITLIIVIIIIGKYLTICMQGEYIITNNYRNFDLSEHLSLQPHPFHFSTFFNPFKLCQLLLRCVERFHKLPLPICILIILLHSDENNNNNSNNTKVYCDRRNFENVLHEYLRVIRTSLDGQFTTMIYVKNDWINLKYSIWTFSSPLP